MAGALDTQLEKQGCYTLGDDHGISPEHIDRALRVMTVDCYVVWFSCCFASFGFKNLCCRTLTVQVKKYNAKNKI